MPSMITDRALRIVAADKIQAAIREGLFDNLPGLGKPSPLCDEPYDPNSWLQRMLQREELIDAIQRIPEFTRQ
jgi:hypothetical protein